MKNKGILDMRMELIAMYPTGYMRGQRIIDMPDYQIYAIYKNHKQRGIPTDRPRMPRPEKQIPGQMNMFERM